MAGITKQRLKELVKEVMIEESEYQAFFQKALDKAGKSIPSMSDEEKKAFFDKIDTAWNGKGEKNEALVGGQKELDVDGDGEIEGSDLADLRAGKKADESVNEDYDGPAILKTGNKNALKVGEKITINSDGKKKEYKVVKSNGNGDFVLHIVESVNELYTWKQIDTASAIISNFTQVEKNIVKKFIEDNNLDKDKISTDTTKLAGRTLFAKAIDAGPNSQIQKDYIKKYALKSGKLTEGRYDADLDKIEAAVKNATSFMNVGSELKKAGIKYDFTTSMIPMYMIKVSGNTIAIVNKKYASDAEKIVGDIAIGLLN
jgi:hypothetical protein